LPLALALPPFDMDTLSFVTDLPATPGAACWSPDDASARLSAVGAFVREL